MGKSYLEMRKMIDSIKIERFKQFKETTVSLKKFSVLMGGNNSGKSSILQAINLLLTVLSSKGNNFISSAKNGNTTDVSISTTGFYFPNIPEITFSDLTELFYLKRTRKGRGGGSESGFILSCQIGKNTYKLQFSQQFGKNLYCKCISKKEDIIEDISFPKALFISGFVGISENEEKMYTLALNDRLNKGRVSSILRNILIELSEKHSLSFQKLSIRLKDDFNFEIQTPVFNEAEDLNIHSGYKEKKERGSFNLDFTALGYGFLQILQILSTIYLYCPEQCRIVLLDEPDAHLHPNLQKQLLDSLLSIQEELDIQIIIATHSIPIIQNTSVDNVIPVYKSKKLEPIADENELFDRLHFIDSYFLGKTIINNKMIFIEDECIEILKHFDKALKTKKASVLTSFEVISGIGKTSKQPYELKGYLKRKGINPEIHFIIDGDGLSDSCTKALRENAERKDVLLHILKKHEIENYILDENLIYEALKENNPDKRIPDIEEIKQKLTEFYKDELTKLTTEDIFGKMRLCFPNEPPLKISCQAGNWLSELKQITDYEHLSIYAPGKECLRRLNAWLRNDLNLNFSDKKLLSLFSEETISNDIKDLFSSICTPNSTT